MIRIDEIYTNTIGPWLEQNRPGTRLLYCDPPGTTDPSALFNTTSQSTVEKDFVFCHDQEPVDADLYQPLFDQVDYRTRDLTYPVSLGDEWSGVRGHVIVSEQGEYVEQVCKRYGWQPHYYFYHGWACLDWFRGYDRTFLIARAQDRSPTQTFMSPNRIIGGNRDHRVLFLYNVFKHGLEHNPISAPRTCPAEGVDIATIAKKYTNVYPDIVDVLNQADLPRVFEGEATQQMTSCWLGNYAEAADSLVYVVTETVYWGRRLHLTEKTFKPICLEMPFILVAPAGSLAYLREYGFRTFDSVWDESYDTETDDVLRIERVTQLLAELERMGPGERLRLHERCLSIVQHNYKHFYGGAFAQILWAEFVTMLDSI